MIVYESNALRVVHRYAVAQGFLTGWLNFARRDRGDGRGLLWCTSLLRPSDAVEFRDVAVAELGHPSLVDVQATWRAVHRWARAHGFETGIPTFESGDEVYGAVLVKAVGRVAWADAPANHLHPTPSLGYPGSVIHAVDDWAVSRGFAAGVPNFERTDHHDGRGEVWGTYGFAAGPDLEQRDVALPIHVPHAPGSGTARGPQAAAGVAARMP